MSPEAQRIAIAEACGWELRVHTYLDGSLAGRSWVAPDGVGRNLPDYLNDLNACHEMEKVLTSNQWLMYDEHIYIIRVNELRGGMHATADQRAEAFLRTIGKWDDTTSTKTTP